MTMSDLEGFLIVAVILLVVNACMDSLEKEKLRRDSRQYARMAESFQVYADKLERGENASRPIWSRGQTGRDGSFWS